jgi:hypothetical protein
MYYVYYFWVTYWPFGRRLMYTIEVVHGYFAKSHVPNYLIYHYCVYLIYLVLY